MPKRPVLYVMLGWIAGILILRLFSVPLLPWERQITAASETAARRKTAAVTGVVTEVRPAAKNCLVTVRHAYLEDGSCAYAVKLVLPKNAEGGTDGSMEGAGDLPSAGDRIRAEGVLRIPDPASNPGQYDAYLASRIEAVPFTMIYPKISILRSGEGTVRRFHERVRDALRRRIRRVYPSDVAGVLGAMLLGDGSAIGGDIRELYADGGIAHLLVVSSLHLQLLSAAAGFALLRAGVPRRAAALLSVLILFAFLLLTGMGRSSLRAFAVFLTGAFARALNRSADPLTSLSFAALILLIVNPYYLFESAFLLSFSAAFLCILVTGMGKLSAAVFLYCGTAPLCAAVFFRLPSYGILCNLIVVPALPLILLAGAAALPFGGLTASAAVWMIRLLNRFLTMVRGLPFSVIRTGRPAGIRLILYIILFAAAVFYYRKMRARRRKVLAIPAILLSLLILRASPVRDFTAVFLDVGQGDGIVLSAPGCTAVVDCGSSTVSGPGTYRLLPYLKSRGLTKIDLLFATHGDEDHISGIREVLAAAGQEDGVSVGALVLPAGMETRNGLAELMELAKEAGIPVRAAKRGDAASFGKLDLEILGPPAGGTAGWDDNAACLVIGVHYGSFDLLLTGDVEAEGEEALLSYLRGGKTSGAAAKRVTYECLKVAHHGSAYSTGAAFLAETDPCFAVISAGRGNAYGHPHPELLVRLEEAGCAVFRTDENGAVTVRSDGVNYSVGTFFGD